MNVSDAPDPADETVFLYDISPELEKELVRRAQNNGRDPAQEAADIIEKHIEEEGEEIR